MDENIKEEIYKCSKCGLCKSVCPVYLATKNEMFSPRGRFIVLNNFFERNKKPSKKFLKNLDICLNCKLCKDFCPSDIDASEIFNNLKKPSKSLHVKLFFIFNFSRLFNFYKKYSPKRNKKNEKILYFEGCYNKYVNCDDRNASIKLIEKLGFEVEKVISDCCGYIYLSNNDQQALKKNEEKIIQSCNSNAKYIICSCDTCYETLSTIRNEEFNKKLIRLDEFLKINNFKINTSQKTSYFKPLNRKENGNVPDNTNTINRKGACSLMENFFGIKHPKLAKKIAENIKYKNDEETITTCNITKWGLSKLLKQKVISYAEYLKKEVD